MSKKPQIYRFRVHLGTWDEHGENCLMCIGGRLIPDGPRHVWLTSPRGEKVLRVERTKIEPLSVDEAVESFMREAKIQKEIKQSKHN